MRECDICGCAVWHTPPQQATLFWCTCCVGVSGCSFTALPVAGLPHLHFNVFGSPNQLFHEDVTIPKTLFALADGKGEVAVDVCSTGACVDAHSTATPCCLEKHRVTHCLCCCHRICRSQMLQVLGRASHCHFSAYPLFQRAEAHTISERKNSAADGATSVGGGGR